MENTVTKELPEIFEEMSKNLQCLEETFETCLAKQGYERSSRTSEGRYPRRSYFKQNTFKSIIDLTMDLNHEGQRYEEFWSEAPFTLRCGTFADISGLRYHDPQTLIYRAKPFNLLHNSLEKDLQEAVSFLSKVSIGDVLYNNNVSNIQKKHDKLLHLTQRSALLFVHSLNSMLHKISLQQPRK